MHERPLWAKAYETIFLKNVGTGNFSMAPTFFFLGFSPDIFLLGPGLSLDYIFLINY